MKKSILCIAIAFISIHHLSAQSHTSESSQKELEIAFAKMWANTSFSNDYDYFKSEVSDNYLTINTEGISQTEEELIVEIDQLKLSEKATFEFFDQKIRIYGDFGVVKGRSKAHFDGEYVAEFLYTALFVKENNEWKYAGWKGTYSKNSPTPILSMQKN
ncbi:MAG: nuclear transport factor 2 family protein [Flavobacteriaceae bacterium]